MEHLIHLIAALIAAALGGLGALSSILAVESRRCPAHATSCAIAGAFSFAGMFLAVSFVLPA